MQHIVAKATLKCTNYWLCSELLESPASKHKPTPIDQGISDCFDKNDLVQPRNDEVKQCSEHLVRCDTYRVLSDENCLIFDLLLFLNIKVDKGYYTM